MLRFAIGQVQFNKLQYFCFLVPHFRFCNFFYMFTNNWFVECFDKRTKSIYIIDVCIKHKLWIKGFTSNIYLGSFFIWSCPYYIVSPRVGLLADQAFGSSWNMERYSTSKYDIEESTNKIHDYYYRVLLLPFSNESLNMLGTLLYITILPPISEIVTSTPRINSTHLIQCTRSM